MKNLNGLFKGDISFEYCNLQWLSIFIALAGEQETRAKNMNWNEVWMVGALLKKTLPKIDRHSILVFSLVFFSKWRFLWRVKFVKPIPMPFIIVFHRQRKNQNKIKRNKRKTFFFKLLIGEEEITTFVLFLQLILLSSHLCLYLRRKMKNLKMKLNIINAKRIICFMKSTLDFVSVEFFFALFSKFWHQISFFGWTNNEERQISKIAR